MQAKGRLQCWNADGQELGGSCREGCAGKGQAATLEQQRLTARLGGSCRAHLKPARKSSTPAVVPGAAPALAKARVGGLVTIFRIKNLGFFSHFFMVEILPQFEVTSAGGPFRPVGRRRGGRPRAAAAEPGATLRGRLPGGGG